MHIMLTDGQISTFLSVVGISKKITIEVKMQKHRLYRIMSANAKTTAEDP